MKKEDNNRKADAIQPGLTGIRRQTLYEIGQTLGMTRDDIANTLQKKKMIQNCVMVVVAFIISIGSYVVYAGPTHYVGMSIKDFDTIGRMMYNVFGRMF